MKYADYRSQIKSGDVLVWTHPQKWYRSWYDFKVALVKFFTKSEYTHTAIAWVVGERVMIIESVVPLVRINPLSNDLPCMVIPGNGLSEHQLETALKIVGKGQYSMWEAVRAYFRTNDMNDNHWECAEFTVSVLQESLPELKSCQATPAAVVKALRDAGRPMTDLHE